MVTHPSTDRARRRVNTLIVTNELRYHYVNQLCIYTCIVPLTVDLFFVFVIAKQRRGYKQELQHNHDNDNDLILLPFLQKTTI